MISEQRWAGRLVWLVLAGSVLFLGARFYYRSTDDFRIAHITYENVPAKKIPLSMAEKHLLGRILEQPFTYVGKGAQSYVFASADGRYVIKFFKFKHLKPNWLVETIPSIGFLKDYKERNVARKNRLIEGVFSGYQIAYDLHREESGILFLQTKPESNQSVVLIDKAGFKHYVRLDQIPFIIQERAQSSKQMVEQALTAHQPELVKKRMRQIIALYLSEYRKGIIDRDHGVLHNTGFVGEKPIHLDVGKVSARKEIDQKGDLEIVHQRYSAWVKEHFPKYYEELSQDFHAAIEESF